MTALSRPFSVCFNDGQGLGGTRPHGLFDLCPILLGRFVIEDFDLAALGHLEVVRGLDLTHRVALAEVQVDLDLVTHNRLLSSARMSPPSGSCSGSAPWPAEPAAPPSSSGRSGRTPTAVPSRTHTRATGPRRSP